LLAEFKSLNSLQIVYFS